MDKAGNPLITCRSGHCCSLTTLGGAGIKKPSFIYQKQVCIGKADESLSIFAP
jgi:hypothetical protein